MTHLEQLQLRLDRARKFFSDAPRRQLIDSAFDLIDAASHCGAPLTLNAGQTQALCYYLDSTKAIREINMLSARTTLDSTPLEAVNIIPFRVAAN